MTKVVKKNVNMNTQERADDGLLVSGISKGGLGIGGKQNKKQPPFKEDLF